MIVFNEFRQYSPIHDCEVVRISVPDEHNREFFMFVKDNGTAREFRESRDTALEAIVTAIQSGLEPGEVRFN